MDCLLAYLDCVNLVDPLPTDLHGCGLQREEVCQNSILVGDHAVNYSRLSQLHMKLADFKWLGSKEKENEESVTFMAKAVYDR